MAIKAVGNPRRPATTRPSIAKLGALSSVGYSGNAVGSGHAASDRCLGLTDHQAVLDAIGESQSVRRRSRFSSAMPTSPMAKIER